MTAAVAVASLARPGRPCLAALAEALAGVRGGDALKPATVVVPSPLSRLHVRRGLGRLGGVAAIDFVTLAELAERLAAPARAATGSRPLPAGGWAEAVRATVVVDPGPFRPVAHHPAAVTTVAAALRRLRAATPAERVALTVSSGRRAPHLVRLLAAVERRTAGHHDRGTAGRAALAALAAGADPGPVVAFCPRGADPGEADLLAALADGGRLRVVAAVTGEPGADGPVRTLVERLEGQAGWRLPPGEDPVPDHLVLAPDAEAEGRLVVQHVASALEAGVAGHDVCVLALGGAAGLNRLADLLDAAGVPWSGPAGLDLAGTPSGRGLVALLGLDARGWSHAGVLAALAAAPLRRAPDQAGPLPLGRWGALAREANVVAGRQQWHERPAALAARARRHGDDATAAELDDLAAFVSGLELLLTPPEQPTWAALAGWALGVLDHLVDPAGPGWPEAEVAAHASVRAAVAGLAELDVLAAGQPAAPGPSDLLAAIEAALARLALRRGRVGQGVLLAGDPVDLLGATPELLLLAGVVEGAVPRRGSDDPLLPAAELGLVAAAPTRAVARAAERAAVLGAIGASGRTVAFAHRADAQAARRPSRWFLGWAGVRAGASSPLGADDLEQASGPWLTVVPSFTATACGVVAGSVQERRLAILASRQRVGQGCGAVATFPLVAGHPALRRAVAAAAARSSSRFTAWDGLLGRRLPLDSEVSASALEDWATCPQRYLFRHVLGVGGTVAPGDVLAVDGADRGSLAHQVLAAVVRRGLGRSPSQPWGDDDRTFLVAELRRRAEGLRDRGRLGRGVLADLRLDELQASLLAALDHDDAARAEEGWVPTAVEEAFGEGVGQPVAVTLPSGRAVRFRGRIDRLDTAEDGRVRVVDYKTGRGQRYLDAPSGGAAAARLLQLAVYEAAARSGRPGSDVSSGWWLIDAVGRDGQPVGIVPNRLGPAAFTAALEAITEGIEAGVFPADPGEDGYRGPDSCRFCPYDRVCPADRVRALERVADDPALGPWRALRSVGDGVAQGGVAQGEPGPGEASR